LCGDVKFSWWWLWRPLPSGVWCSVSRMNLLTFGGTFRIEKNSTHTMEAPVSSKTSGYSTRVHGVTYLVFTFNVIIFCEWYLCIQRQY
jgi:hypothetical protein